LLKLFPDHIKPLSHQYGVLTAFPQCLKIAERRGARCANASNAVQTLCNRLERHAAAFVLSMLRVRAVNTMQQLLARCENVTCTRYYWQIWYIFRRFYGDPTARWHGFRTLYKRCGIAVWCDRGLCKTSRRVSLCVSTYCHDRFDPCSISGIILCFFLRNRFFPSF